MALHALHLCSGYGGFELALREWGVRTVCHVERDAHAAATLVARMEEATLDQAPIWDDLCTFDGRPWRGRVDIVTAGFPCQPFSTAGQRRGLDDERWIWPDIARIIRDVGPRYVILENVPGLVRHGLPHVLNDLASLRFDAEWGCLSAAAVGAPHKRERVWIVAHRVRSRREGETGTERGLSVFDESGRCVANADSNRRGGVGHEVGTTRERTETVRAGEDVGNTDSIGGQSVAVSSPTRAEHARAYCGSAHAWPPGRDDSAGWAEWVTAGNAEPVVRGGVDGVTGRMVGGIEIGERLHLLGNGLVPQCATEAISQLLARRGWALQEMGET